MKIIQNAENKRFFNVFAYWECPMCEKFWCSMALTVKIFHHQIISNLPWKATEMVRFLKTYEIWVFWNEKDGFFEKKTWIFFKVGKSGKFALKYVSNDVIS